MLIKSRIDLIKLLPELPIAVEVGTAEGLFSEDLLRIGVHILYSVDNWEHIPGVTGDGNSSPKWHLSNFVAAKQRLSKYGERSIILKGMSVQMADKIPDNSLDLVYLDGAHYTSGVLADLNAYYPKLKSGAVMSGHDWLNTEDYGVNDAVNRFVSGLNLGIEVFTIPENNIKDASFYFIKP